MVDEDAPTRAAPGASTLTAGDATQPAPIATPTSDTLVPTFPRVNSAPIDLPAPGYQLGELIGKGGMGEVVAAHDQRIGREVAIKRMRSALPDGEQLARFLREARIQARLDHPAVVPVYELGHDAAGRPYFTMKRISGRTLGERIAGGATTQALLRAFVDVCLAVEFAHARAVIHRDLKPSNIMLGDYGEVYVLDWGVARVLTDTKDRPSPDDIQTLDDGTQTGAMLGTPGYMSPEQVKGQPATQAADVYALGSILFEILAGEALHPKGSAAIASTLSRPQEAPAHRRSDRPIPPELDSLCHGALGEEPATRPSARELADKVQAYLDGDRDVERRRLLAAEQLALANDALSGTGADARATAVRRAGRALALDPDSTEAAELVTRLIVEPPAELPPEIQEALDGDERKVTAQRSKAGLYAYLSLYGYWLAFPFLGIKNWAWLVILYTIVTALALITYVAMRRGTYRIGIGLVGNLLFAIAWTRIAGPFMLTPVLLCGVLLALTTAQFLIDRPWMILLWTSAAFLIPISLEWLHVLTPTWEVGLTSITARSVVFEMEGPIAEWSLIFANIMFVTVVGMVGLQVHKAAKLAKRKLGIQNWHLQHLLPSSPRPWSTRR
ncbi:MAG: serine/threonine protein kinase [Myxococcales bacterium]|nr:serine/threonine protein kinase [Myxococcales bacterium]